VVIVLMSQSVPSVSELASIDPRPNARWIRLISLGCTVLLVLSTILTSHPLLFGGVKSAAAAPGSEVIVVLDDDADPLAVAERRGITPTQVYRHVFNGFAGRLPEVSAQSLESDSDVVAIAPDFPISGAAERIPSGVERSWAAPDQGGASVSNLIAETGPVDAMWRCLIPGST
jgi:hypothetical protein